MPLIRFVTNSSLKLINSIITELPPDLLLSSNNHLVHNDLTVPGIVNISSS